MTRPRHLLLRRTVGVGTLLVCWLAVVTPAFAAPSDPSGGQDSLSAGQAILLFGALPVALFLLIGLLALLPGLVRESRYRPARGWEHEPVWFQGPTGEAPPSAEERARGRRQAKGGASGEW